MLRNKLKEIAESPGTVLKEFHVIGTASPDGHYNSNLNLAEKTCTKDRTGNYICTATIYSGACLPNPHAESGFVGRSGENCWKRDGKSTEAGKVKEILAKNKGIEAQGRALKQLDWYPTVIVPYLDELRVVNYNCLYEIYREPNDEEVMAQYREKG